MPIWTGFNWDKTLQMQVATAATVVQPCGAPIKCVREAVYLGGLISCDGKASRELSRRLGEGRAIFDSLAKVWPHTNITITRKIKLYISCVANKILYSLDSLWLLQAERRRLDAFHFRCLRKLLRIPCSCLESRIWRFYVNPAYHRFQNYLSGDRRSYTDA